MLSALPTARDFRGELRAARTSAGALRVQRLRALSQHRLDYLETLQLDRALQALPAEERALLAPVRVAVLSSATIDQLLPAIRVAALRRGLDVYMYAGGYGQYRQETFEPPPALRALAPELVLFSVSARELLGSIPLTARSREADEHIDSFVAGLRGLWRRARAGFDAGIVHQTFLDVTEPVFGSFDRLAPGAPARIVDRLNLRLAEAAVEDDVALLDVARASERTGRDFWFSQARWLQAKQEIAPPAAPAYGELLARIIAARRGLSRKCLVLDLDNTLWGGVIGDEGLQGIVLGAGSAAGEAHAGLQRYAKQLRERGILLAICSKNERATAIAAIERHPEMILRMADFAAVQVNWTDKAENLRAIAQQLNIGPDSLVFVDDSAVERARIREALPMVAVPELPEDVADYVSCLAGAGYFEAVALTSDDRLRAAQYAQNAARDNFRESQQSMGEFLRGLEMKLDCRAFAEVDLPRVTQLINKTNQFNTTGRRHGAEAVAKFAAAAADITLQLRLTDRFGDNGLVSVLILRPLAEDPQAFELDTWVMSCRVFGRELEYEASNIAVETVRARGATRIVADYVRTDKNGVIAGLFAQLGFVPLAEPPADGSAATTRWVLTLADYRPRTTCIERRSG